MQSNTKWVVLLFFLFIIPLVAAETGCFLYLESPYYCMDLETEGAAEECAFYDSCLMEEYFKSGESCTDTLLYPECQEVLCKSSCEQTLSGLCAAGEVPPEEESEWCSFGCCMFSYAEGEYCAEETNKWLCENEANNKGISNYLYDATLTGEECKAQCESSVIGGELGVSTEETIPEPNLPETAPTTTTSTSISGKVQEPVSEGASSWWWVLGTLVLVGLVYLAVHTYLRWEDLFGKTENVKRNQYFKESFNDFVPSSRFDNSMTFKIAPETPASDHKKKARLRKSYLMDAGLTPIIVGENVFSKLKRLVTGQKPKVKYTERLREVVGKRK